MSRNIEDVRDKIEGQSRIKKYPNYWQPLLNTYDSSSISFSKLYKYLIEDTEQHNIKYNFSDENCKKFAKIVFDKIARNKTWNYVIWNIFGIYFWIQIHIVSDTTIDNITNIVFIRQFAGLS